MNEDRDREIDLTPEQIAEIERRLSDDEPFATVAEVRETFRRMTRPAIGDDSPDTNASS
jgi:hypothetical protein